MVEDLSMIMVLTMSLIMATVKLLSMIKGRLKNTMSDGYYPLDKWIGVDQQVG